MFDIPNKSQNKIDDQGRSHGQKGDINEPCPDPAGGNTQSFPDSGTYAKKLPFDEVSEPVHTAKLLNKEVFGNLCFSQ